MTPEEAIRSNAQRVHEYFSAPNLDPSDDDFARRFGYNYVSVMRVEQFIEEERKNPDRTQQDTENTIEFLGSWLGECIVAIYGGAWKRHGDQWGVFFDDRNAAFPFVKVRKQFETGLEGGESILGFFKGVGAVRPKV